MKANIAAIEYALPDRRITNDELDLIHPQWSVHRAAKVTGVRQRYVCGEGETSLDLAMKACEKLFERGEVAKKDVGALILCSQSPDYIMPPNSTILHHKLGLPISVAAFDYTLACSGYIYGLFIAKAFIESNLLDNVILVTAEAYSKYINPDDRGTVTLFGDGAAATLICRGNRGIGEIELGTDGSGGRCFNIPAGGTRMPKSSQTMTPTVDDSGNIRTLENIHMDGQAVLRLIKRQVPDCIRSVLDKSRVSLEDIDMYFFHQSSKLSLDYLEKSFHLPSEKVWRNIEFVGNTVSASIPIAIRDAELAGSITPGSRLLLAGFGVGFSWGACIVDW